MNKQEKLLEIKSRFEVAKIRLAKSKSKVGEIDKYLENTLG